VVFSSLRDRVVHLDVELVALVVLRVVLPGLVQFQLNAKASEFFEAFVYFNLVLSRLRGLSKVHALQLL
jgi:hypothetical protein